MYRVFKLIFASLLKLFLSVLCTHVEYLINYYSIFRRIFRNTNLSRYGFLKFNFHCFTVVELLLRTFIMIKLSITPSESFVPSYSLRQAALDWFERNYDVIPIIPDTKQTAVKWYGWLAGLSLPTITAYWLLHPKNELGFIVGDNIVVLDADSPESVAALIALEVEHGVKPNLVINTKKGVHHHLKRAAGTLAKSDSHCTKKHPERIDIKTGRAMVILPPSSGKSIALNEIKNADDLTEIGQDFIDAINSHNGRKTLLSIGQSSSVIGHPLNTEHGCLGIQALLALIDADCGYDDWLRALMGVFHHTNGSDNGFEIANTWSRTGSKYKSEKEIRAKWNSFNLQHPRPVTLGTIISMVKNGHEIYHEAENQFEDLADAAAGGAK